MGARANAKAIARNPKFSLCIRDEKWPPTDLLVYCDARIETEPLRVVDLMLRIARVMAGKPMPDSVRPIVEEGAEREGRSVVRCTPYETFHSPPKHVRDAEGREREAAARSRRCHALVAGAESCASA